MNIDIENIIDCLGIDYTVHHNRISFACPIHNGDNPSGSCIYLDTGVWKCYTHNCHSKYGSSIECFIKAFQQKNNIENNYINDVLNNIKVEKNNPNFKFNKSVNILTKKRRNIQYRIPVNTIDQYSKNVDFYLQRGFKDKTLDKFGIRYCKDRKKIFFEHVVVPIFNDDGLSIAGFIARNVNPKCLICKKHHKENQPCPDFDAPKWKNTKGFYNNSYFYNLWNAKEYIQKTNSVILVESAADVWRFFEAGIYNVLGLFGTFLSEDQKIILEKLPVQNVYIFLDPDEPGQESSKIMEKYLEKLYNVKNIYYTKQPADCSPEELLNIWKSNII